MVTLKEIKPSGRDFKGKSTDVHVRKERNTITTDVFDSSIADADQAHITSERFPYSRKGLRQVIDLLKGEGVRVQRMKQKRLRA